MDRGRTRDGRPPAALALAGTLVAMLVWWNVGLMAQFGLHLMDRQRLSLGRNARATFVELPLEMPSLVARYFTRPRFVLPSAATRTENRGAS